MLRENAARIGEQFWEGADLVMEIVSGSDDDRRRDLVTKRSEYALAGIPEYWIVDPREGRITVLHLDGDSYALHGEFTEGSRATSVLLPGFSVDAAEALAAGKEA
jgi:Uma2 family endonuclease